MRHRPALVTASALILGAGILAAAQPVPRDAPPPPPASGQGSATDMGAQIMAALKATPGCLGVDAGEWQSGKATIAAWFENKAAVIRWYHSEAHLGLMENLMPDFDAEHNRPLEHVRDDRTPIMVLATLTPNPAPRLEGVRLPISQISIELFQPLPGGAAVNGRLAPPTFKVPHMNLIGPQPEPAPAPAAGRDGR